MAEVRRGCGARQPPARHTLHKATVTNAYVFDVPNSQFKVVNLAHGIGIRIMNFYLKTIFYRFALCRGRDHHPGPASICRGDGQHTAFNCSSSDVR